MKLFRLLAVLVAVTLLIGVVPLVSASNPAGLGTPTLHVRSTSNPLVSEIVADGINDDALMAASESSLSPAQQRRLQQLTEFGGQRRLSTSEEAELAHLLELYNRSVLRRAKALAILSQRGYQLPDQVAFIDSDGGYE